MGIELDWLLEALVGRDLSNNGRGVVRGLTKEQACQNAFLFKSLVENLTIWPMKVLHRKPD